MALSILPIVGFPMISPGDDLAGAIASALARQDIALRPTDVLVVAQKIVSKAEGRYLELATLTPSSEAQRLAAITGKEARHVQAILDESERVVRAAPHLLLVRHRLGFVMANAGIDQSNIDDGTGDRVLLLPRDPDVSATALRQALGAAIIISDSFGRPFRMGSVNVAIGAAGLPALIDRRGELDLNGRVLQTTEIAYADQIASAAGLVIGEAAEGVPLALVRGLGWSEAARPAADLLRPVSSDRML
ncbi:MAG: coenzyme F420-0:L-glutamate ligase [Hyphomicrobiales bacterium]|nr:MAG: coenzyme F420-0:L-glutamate ligase [Hyphomicrobiales bacterium]